MSTPEPDDVIKICGSRFYDLRDRQEIAAGGTLRAPWFCLGNHRPGERHSTLDSTSVPITWTDDEAEPHRGPITPEGASTP